MCAKCQSSADAFVEDYRDWSKNCAKKDQVTFAPGAPNGVDIPAWASAGSVSGSWSFDTLKNAASPTNENNAPKKKLVEYKEPEHKAEVNPEPEAEPKTPPQQDVKPQENIAVGPAPKQEDPKSGTLQLPQSSGKPKEYANSSKTRDLNSVSTSSSTSTTSTQRSQTKARPFVPNFTPRPLDSAQAVAEEEDDEEEPPSVEENDLTAQGKEAGQADNQKHREEPGDDHSIPEGLNNDNTLNLAAADAGPSTKAANGQRIRPLANGQDDLAQEDSPFVPKIKTPTRTTSSASSQLPTMLADGISDLGASAEYDIDAEEDSEDDIALPPKDFAALPDLSDDPEDGIDGTESEEYNETEENDEDDANPDEDHSTSTVSELLQAEETAISSLEGMSDTSKDADAPSDEPDAADRDSDTADNSDIPEQASDGEEAGFGAVGRYQYNGDPGVEVVENEEKENKKKIAIICGTLAALLVLGVVGFKLFMCLRRREDDNDIDDDRESWMRANPTGITKESVSVIVEYRIGAPQRILTADKFGRSLHRKGFWEDNLSGIVSSAL